MKITDIRFVELEGVLKYEGELWESLNCSPIQIYPEYRGKSGGVYAQDARRRLPDRRCLH